MIVFRILLHLSPLIPVALGRMNIGAIMLLFLLLCYIKTFKLRQQILELAAKGAKPEELASYQNALKRWHALTFLKAF